VGTVLDDPPPFDRDDAPGVPQCRQPMAIKMTVRFWQMRRISDYRSAEAVWGKFAADSPVEGDGFEPSVPGESGFGFAREGPNIRIQLQRRVIQTR
jgi:hypothetical protein